MMLWAVGTVIAATTLWWCMKPSKNKRVLKDKHVFITGGSSGIGFSLAQEALMQGAFVTLVSRSHSNLTNACEKLISQVPSCNASRVLLKVADVGDYDAISNAINEAFSWKAIDVLICNAGLARQGHLGTLSAQDIDLIIRTNFNGVAYSVNAALPSIKTHSQQKPASIVIIGSLASLTCLYGQGIYTGTKFALKGLAEALKLELNPYNISVSLACPGFVDTPILQHVFLENDTSEYAKKLKKFRDSTIEDPKELAKRILDEAMKGTFLIAKKDFVGLYLCSLSRGIYPAEGIGRVLLEMVLYFPFRVLSLLDIFLDAQNKIKR